ncbi:MAG: protein kinase [Planctomycetaceae bacterium]|nr:protein kinase [Planctomycetaceae bacterium]
MFNATVSQSEQASDAAEVQETVTSARTHNREADAVSHGDSAETPAEFSIGRFHVKRILGTGGFGKVYLADDSLLHRTVALKVPRSLHTDSPQARRFHTEARAAARLKHPNIVAVYETGEADGVAYIVTEYVRGTTLSRWVREHSMDQTRIAVWLRALGAALAYAHEEKVIHRDIKPDNILISESGRPMLLDFGLAKQMDQDSSLTADGVILGTPAYMSPEQARGEIETVGPLSDQYSLGAVLYECLTAKRPFSGPAHAVINKVVNEGPVSPSSINQEISPDLEAICLKAMSRNAADRYPGMTEFVQDLERWLAGAETSARPAGVVERCRRWYRENTRLALSLCTAAVSLIAVAVLMTIAFFREAELRSNAVEQQRIAEAAQQREADARIAAEEATRKAEAALREKLEAENALAAAEVRMSTAETAAEEAQRLEQEARAQTQSRQEADLRLARGYLSRGRELVRRKQPEQAYVWFAEALCVLPQGAHSVESEIRSELAACPREAVSLVAMSEPGGFTVEPGRRFSLIRHFPTSDPERPAEERGRYSLTSIDSATTLAMLQHRTSVTAGAFNPAETSLLTAASYYSATQVPQEYEGKSTVYLWNLQPAETTAETTASQVEVSGRVNDFIFSPDGTAVLVVTQSCTMVDQKQSFGAGQVLIYTFPQMQHLTTISLDGRPSDAIWSRDGDRIVTTQQSLDPEANKWVVSVWDAVDGRPIGSRAEFDGTVKVIPAANPDRRMVSVSTRENKHYLQLMSGDNQRIGEAVEFTGAPAAVALSPDGERYAAVTGKSHTLIQLRSLETGEIQTRFSIGDGAVSLCFADHGDTLLMGFELGNGASASGEFQEWDLATQKQVVKPVATRHPVEVICVDARSQIVITGGSNDISPDQGFDGSVEIWDRSRQQRIGEPIRHDSVPHELVFNQETQQLVLRGSRDYLWNLPGVQPPSPWPLITESRVQDFCVFDATSVACVTAGGRIYLLRENSARAEVLNSRIQYPKKIKVAMDGKSLVVANSDQVEMWDLSNQPGVYAGGFNTAQRIDDVQLSPTGRSILIKSPQANSPQAKLLAQNLLHNLHRLPDGDMITVFQSEGYSYADDSTVFSPDGRYVAAVGVDHAGTIELQVIDSVSGRVQKRRSQDSTFREPVLAFSPDGRLLAVWNRVLDVIVEEIDLDSLEPKTRHQPFPGSLLDGPNDLLQVIVFHQNSVQTWDVLSGKKIGAAVATSDFGGRLAPAGRYAFVPQRTKSPDSGKKTLSQTSLVNIESGEEISRLEGSLYEREFSSDGSWFFRADRDGFTIWDSATGKVWPQSPLKRDFFSQLVSYGNRRLLVNDEASIRLLSYDELDAEENRTFKIIQRASPLTWSFAARRLVMLVDDELCSLDAATLQQVKCTGKFSHETRSWIGNDPECTWIAVAADEKWQIQRWQIGQPECDDSQLMVDSEVKHLVADSASANVYFVTADSPAVVSCRHFDDGTTPVASMQHTDSVRELALSPDDRVLAVRLSEAILLYDLSGGEHSPVTVPCEIGSAICWADPDHLAVVDPQTIWLHHVGTGDQTKGVLTLDGDEQMTAPFLIGRLANENTLVVADSRTIQLYDAQSLTQKARLQYSETHTPVAVDLANSVTVMSHRDDGAPLRIQRYALPVTEPADRLKIIAELRSQLTVGNDGTLRELTPAEWSRNYSRLVTE